MVGMTATDFVILAMDGSTTVTRLLLLCDDVTRLAPLTYTLNELLRVPPLEFVLTLSTSALNSMTTYSASASLSLFVIVPRLKSGSLPSGKGFVPMPGPLFVMSVDGKTKVGVTFAELPEITGLEPMPGSEEDAQFAPLLQTKATLVVPSLR